MLRVFMHYLKYSPTKKATLSHCFHFRPGGGTYLVMRPSLRCGRPPRHKLLVPIILTKKATLSHCFYVSSGWRDLPRYAACASLRPPSSASTDAMLRVSMHYLKYSPTKKATLSHCFYVSSGWRDSNPHARASDPKSDMSTNFTTPGDKLSLLILEAANILRFFISITNQCKESFLPRLLCYFATLIELKLCCFASSFLIFCSRVSRLVQAQD